MTKTVFTDSQNIFVSGGPFKTESKKEKFPPKITLQNTKKGFRKLYELVMDLSNIQVIPYALISGLLSRSDAATRFSSIFFVDKLYDKYLTNNLNSPFL